MKVSCITISNNTIQSQEQANIVNFLDSKLKEFGVGFTSICSVSNELNSLSRVLNTLGEELIFVLCGDTATFNYDIKTHLSNIYSEDLVLDDELDQVLTNVCTRQNIDKTILDKDIYILNNALPIYDTDSYLFGCLYKHNDTILVLLPEVLSIVKKMYDTSLKDILSSVFDVNASKIFTLKTYGVSIKDIQELLVGYTDNIYGIKYSISSNNLDTTISLYNDNADDKIMQEYVAETISRLKKYIYSTSNISIYKMAYDLLHLSKKSICITETITGGYFASKINSVENDMVNIESRAYSSVQCLCDKFGVKYTNDTDNVQTTIKMISDVSTKVFESAGVDIVLGIYGEYKEDNAQNMGYISVCDEDGIHIYKSVMSCNRGDMIDILSKAGAFHLIKKIKENSLLF